MKWKRSKKAQQEEKNGKKDGKDKTEGDKMEDEGQVIDFYTPATSLTVFELIWYCNMQINVFA